MQKEIKKTVILGITGGIAAYKACELTSRLRKKGNTVVCIMTGEAEEFITPLTMETLSGNKVYRDMFQLPERREIAHISLADKADLIVVYPATANIIGKLAQGICDDLLICTAISSKAPILIAPAMNENMYKNAIVQGNILKLKKTGYKFVGPVRGHLACGSAGIGHIAEPESVMAKVSEILAKS